MLLVRIHLLIIYKYVVGCKIANLERRVNTYIQKKKSVLNWNMMKSGIF